MSEYLAGVAVLFAVFFVSGWTSYDPGLDRAEDRANAYAESINHDYREPEKIYRFLTAEIRSAISEEAFCEAFAKERSYPYITPLYIFYPELTIDPNGNTAQVVFKQAARIVGMEYTIRLVYENGDYYVEDWEQFIDGSYLNKFDHIPYSLDWYYDIDD